jgi:hypothetical protein
MATSGDCPLSLGSWTVPMTQPQQFSVNTTNTTFQRNLTLDWISLLHSRRQSLRRLNWSLHLSSQSQSFVMTDSQLSRLSWYQAPSWGPWPYFYYCQTFAGLLMLCAPSEERRVCSFHLLLAPARAVILGSESHGTHKHISLSQIQDSANLVSQVPVFISSGSRVAELYP